MTSTAACGNCGHRQTVVIELDGKKLAEALLDDLIEALRFKGVPIDEQKKPEEGIQ